MPLSPAEKTAGKLFRDAQQARLDVMPEAAPCAPFIREYRHDCPKNGGASTVLRLHERYEESPEYWVCYCSTVAEFVRYVFPHEDCQGGKPITPPGFFGFIWLEGTCRCGLSVRSGRGRLVLKAARPPLEKRSGLQPGILDVVGEVMLSTPLGEKSIDVTGHPLYDDRRPGG